MRLGYHQLIVTRHAHQRRCQRIGPISLQDLEAEIREQLRQPCRRSGAYLQTQDNTWWRVGVSDGLVTFYTCYGRTHVDIPEAVKWAKRHHDRIDLRGGLDVGGYVSGYDSCCIDRDGCP